MGLVMSATLYTAPPVAKSQFTAELEAWSVKHFPRWTASQRASLVELVLLEPAFWLFAPPQVLFDICVNIDGLREDN